MALCMTTHLDVIAEEHQNIGVQRPRQAYQHEYLGTPYWQVLALNAVGLAGLPILLPAYIVHRLVKRGAK